MKKELCFVCCTCFLRRCRGLRLNLDFIFLFVFCFHIWKSIELLSVFYKCTKHTLLVVIWGNWMHVSYLKCVTQRNHIDTESSSRPFCHRQTSLTQSVRYSPYLAQLTLVFWLHAGLRVHRSFWQVTCRVTLRSAV